MFKEFPKIARWSKDVVVTEKIDGTNACVIIQDSCVVGVQSRNRLITPKDDNYGFAKWVEANKDVLAEILGDGYHYGEWWGAGIGRGYDMTSKRFSLFNVSRWDSLRENEKAKAIGMDCVPTLYKGNMDDMNLNEILWKLEKMGSVAAHGFMKPEGIVIFHTVNGALFKKTFEHDKEGKGVK